MAVGPGQNTLAQALYKYNYADVVPALFEAGEYFWAWRYAKTAAARAEAAWLRGDRAAVDRATSPALALAVIAYGFAASVVAVLFASAFWGSDYRGLVAGLFVGAMAALIVAVRPPGSSRRCSDVSPSPWRTASTSVSCAGCSWPSWPTRRSRWSSGWSACERSRPPRSRPTRRRSPRASATSARRSARRRS